MNSRLTTAIHIVGMIAWIEREQARPATSRELAASVGSHEVYIRGILADLGRAKLTSSTRGRNGGTVLARPAGKITLAQVYEAVRNEEESLLGSHSGQIGRSCAAAPVIADYLSGIYGAAEKVLVQSLATHTVENMSKSIVEGIRSRVHQRKLTG